MLENGRKPNESQYEALEKLLESPEPTDDQLWEYALDLMGLDEQERMIKRISQSTKAQSKLARIREAIFAAKSQVYSEATLIKTVRVKARQLLARMGEDLSTLAAIIVNTKDGLTTACQEACYVFRDPALNVLNLGEEVLGDIHHIAYSSELTANGPEGVSITLVKDPTNGGINIRLDINKEPLEGNIEVYKCVEVNGNKNEKRIRGLSTNLKAGSALLKNCPVGLIKISLPGERFVQLYLSSEGHGD